MLILQTPGKSAPIADSSGFTNHAFCSFRCLLSIHFFLQILLFCSSGLTCPAADFVEESFLMAAKCSLSEQGLFAINLVSRSPTVKEMVFSRVKKVRTESQLTR